MATIEEAKLVWQHKSGQFKKQRPFRIGYMGDGLGTDRANMYSSRGDTYIYIRDDPSAKGGTPVLNKRVNPVFNAPVVIGYTDNEPNVEQVLGIHWDTLELITTPTDFGGFQPHHTQHEFGGGDEVFIDSRLFKAGLVKPTDPPSMKVDIMAFSYSYNGWKRFPQTKSIDLTPYIPDTDSRYVSICLDPASNKLVYRDGIEFSPDQTWATILTPIETVLPGPSGDEIPLGSIYLTASTTTIDWIPDIDNIFDIRYHIAASLDNIRDRIAQLEGITGFKPNLATTGAADLSANLENGWIVNGNTISTSRATVEFVSAATIQTADGQLTIDASGGIVVNEDGDDEDFRIEGLTESNLLFIDAGNDRVGIGTNAPTDRVHIQNGNLLIKRSDAGAAFALDYNGVSANHWKISAETNGNFVLQDVDGGFTNPFQIEGGAPNNSFRVQSTGDITLGNNTAPTGGGNVVVFGDNGGNPTMGNNTAGIYAKDVTGTVEMFAVDEADNVTQLSPHDPETGEWIFYSKNTKTGKTLRVDMERLIRKLDDMLGGGFVKEWIELT